MTEQSAPSFKLMLDTKRDLTLFQKKGGEEDQE